MMRTLLETLAGFWALGLLACAAWFLIRPFLTSTTADWARFGALVKTAATMPVPEHVQLKDPKTFKLIGHTVPRVDAVAKSCPYVVITVRDRRRDRPIGERAARNAAISPAPYRFSPMP